MKKGGNTRLRPRPFIGRGLFYAGNRVKTFPGILKNIFSLRIINLENAEVNVQKIPEGIRANYLDGDVEETSKDIVISKDIGKYKVKEKKKIKIFS